MLHQSLPTLVIENININKKESINIENYVNIYEYKIYMNT